MSGFRKNIQVTGRVLSLGGLALLVACQPVTAPDPAQAPEQKSKLELRPEQISQFKPPPKIELLPIPAGGLTEDQREEREEAQRWNAIYVCFRCHDMSERTISQQPRRRQKKHRKAMKRKRSCLDCHNDTDVRCCHNNLFPKVERWD